MTDKDQTDGRTANGASPGGKPDASTSSADVKRNGERERTPPVLMVRTRARSARPSRRPAAERDKPAAVVLAAVSFAHP